MLYSRLGKFKTRQACIFKANTNLPFIKMCELTKFIIIKCRANRAGSEFSISKHRNVNAKESNFLGLGKSPFKDLTCEAFDF